MGHYLRIRGFTLIELLIVVGIVGLLSSMVVVSIRSAREKAYLARAITEFRSIHTALEYYVLDNDTYPADVSRNIPPGIQQYLGPGLWPAAPWVGSVYDWDNWDDPVTSEKIYQISIRFCSVGQPGTCKFPNQPWAANFGVDSSVYYCISGTCRSHIGQPLSYPGYCVNC